MKKYFNFPGRHRLYLWSETDKRNIYIDGEQLFLICGLNNNKYRGRRYMIYATETDRILCVEPYWFEKTAHWQQ